MIAGLGPISQLAFVPADFDRALDYWTRVMGVGPFFLMEHIAVPAMWYRGQPTMIDFSIAIGYWNDLQIELVQQHDDTPSIYREWLEAGHEGLHHVCQFVDDLAAAKRVCAKAGAEIVQELTLDDGGGAIYVDAGGGPGTLVEIVQSPPALLTFFAHARAAARDWDGTDPLRKIG